MALSRHEAFRRAIRDLNLIARRDLELAVRTAADPRDAKRVLEELLPEIVAQYGNAAASIAADYFEELRDATKIAGRFTAKVPPVDPNDMGTKELVYWALGEAKDGASFTELVAGGTQRRIANVSRDTVVRSSLADPKCRGWMRVGSGECDFCSMLIGRGAVYTKASVDFASHDHCNCAAAPAWRPDDVHSISREFVGSARRRSEKTKAADAARVRAWITDNT